VKIVLYRVNKTNFKSLLLSQQGKFLILLINSVIGIIYERVFKRRLGSLLGFIMGAGIITILLGSLSITNPFYLSKSKQYLIFPNGTAGLACIIISLITFIFWNFSNHKKELQRVPPSNLMAEGEQAIFNKPSYDFMMGMISSFILLILSEWATLKFGFFPEAYFAKISIYFIPVFYILSYYFNLTHIRIASIICILLLALSFIINTELKPLFTDDHASVIYRLQLLSDYFPRIPLYNTEWNAGMDWRDFFATGILNVFLIFYPLFILFPTEDIYSIIVFLILFGITPISTYLGSRLLGSSHSVGLISSVLVITANTSWYKWALSYGSMGFVCSTALFPLLLSLSCVVLRDKELSSLKNCSLLVIIGTLCLFWSAQGLSLIALLVIALFAGKKFLFSKRILLTLFALVCLNGPWMSLFIKVSKVTSFVSLEDTSKTSEKDSQSITNEKLLSNSIVKGKSDTISKKNVLRSFRENFLKINPMLLILGIPGLLLFYRKDKKAGLPFIATCIWLFILGTIIVHLKPQLELDRMLVILSLCLSLPVANLLGEILSFRKLNQMGSFSLGICCIMTSLLIGVISTNSIFENRSWEKYKTISNSFGELAEAIKTHRGSGRTLFAGFILHELEGGHIAPLTRLSESPIMASSPIHNLWWYTDIIPEAYRKRGAPGIEEYLDLYNVSLVIAHEKAWKDYFRRSAIHYEEVAIVDRFVILKRLLNPNSYFLEGEGTLLSQKGDGLSFTLDTEAAILRFNYLTFLEIDGCKDIKPHPVSETVTLIKVEDCMLGRTITINSLSPLDRLLLH